MILKHKINTIDLTMKKNKSFLDYYDFLKNKNKFYFKKIAFL